MTLRKHQRRALLSWLFVGMLFALCGLLGVLQYRWLGEVSAAARDRLHGSLQATLVRLSQGFNADLAAACAGLVPTGGQTDTQSAEKELLARVDRWKETTRHRQLIGRLAIAVPQKDELRLLAVDINRGTLQDSAWPEGWNGVRTRMQARLSNAPPEVRGSPGRPGDFNFFESGEDYLSEVPLFAAAAPGVQPNPFARREVAWLVVELNPIYLRDTLLPEIVQRYLGAGGSMDYVVQVVSRSPAKSVIYQSDPGHSSIASTADASTSLFEPQQFLWSGPAGRGPGQGRGPGPDAGHWQIYVRHRAGSLEAVVARTRWRNLGVVAGVLLLIVATAGALIRWTRHTQRLAELQMDFVAGVSHELRTPLTVIHTAGYNLQGKMARDPAQVEKYGALIHRESGRLNSMVEQILRFATVEAGHVIQEREPLSVESLMEEAVTASKPLIDESHCVIEKRIAPGLPLILGDRVALRQAIENLVSNAAKYGLKGGNWIGISAARRTDAVEIRVADRGPGIPIDEQQQIFDPFFRGARAREDQIRGTGIGLSLVRRIVEAHGGSIRVESAPAKGTAFILLLPVAPAGVEA